MTIDPAQIIHSISVIFSGHLSSIPIKLWLDKQQILQNRKSRFEKKKKEKKLTFFWEAISTNFFLPYELEI